MHNLESKISDQLKILYIDDSIVNLQLFEITFKNRFEVKTAKLGQDGLAILKNNKDIDVVISDYSMPYMNGLEFIKKARKIKDDIPFYILSCSPETDEISEAIQNKLIDYFFRKPLNRDHLLKKIYGYYAFKLVKN